MERKLHFELFRTFFNIILKRIENSRKSFSAISHDVCAEMCASLTVMTNQ